MPAEPIESGPRRFDARHVLALSPREAVVIVRPAWNAVVVVVIVPIAVAVFLRLRPLIRAGRMSRRRFARRLLVPIAVEVLLSAVAIVEAPSFAARPGLAVVNQGAVFADIK